MDNLFIRQARAEDVSWCLSLERELAPEAPQAIERGFLLQGTSKETFEDYLQTAIFYVAEEDKQRVGFLIALPAQHSRVQSLLAKRESFELHRPDALLLPSLIWLAKVAVILSMMRQGVASALYARLFQDYPQSNFLTATLTSPLRNLPSEQLQERFGFERIGLFRSPEHGDLKNLVNTIFLRQNRVLWLLDVDGVVTSLETRKIPHPEMTEALAARVRDGDLIALLSGRPLSFITEQVMSYLSAAVEQTSLQQLCLIGEKGATWLIYNGDGSVQEDYERSLVPPNFPEFRQDALRLLDDYGDVVEFDPKKITMFTLVLKEGQRMENLLPIEEAVACRLERLLEKHHLESIYHVVRGNIAIDVEHLQMSKAQGARRAVSIFQEKGFIIGKVEAVGDTPSDLEVRTGLAAIGLPFLFTYVGAVEDLPGVGIQGINVLERQYTKGTLSLLRGRHCLLLSGVCNADKDKNLE